MQISGNAILVTGGNSGLGRRFAEEFARRGNKVIITGRKQDTIDQVVAANPGITGYLLDVTDAQAIKDFAAKIVVEHPDLNVRGSGGDRAGVPAREVVQHGDLVTRVEQLLRDHRADVARAARDQKLHGARILEWRGVSACSPGFGGAPRGNGRERARGRAADPHA